MPEPTNILALPLVHLEIETGNNEDWIDSMTFLVDDGSGDSTNFPPLDLTGISFLMEIRRRAEDHEVVITGSTEDGRLSLGTYPSVGTLIIRIDDSTMRTVRAGTYVGDITATDDVYSRTPVQFDLTVFEGITK